MLILSREIGQAIVIDDVVVTVIRVGGRSAEVSLQKLTGGKRVVATLLRDEPVDACYNTRLLFIESRGPKVRLGIDAPDGIEIRRQEV